MENFEWLFFLLNKVDVCLSPGIKRPDIFNIRSGPSRLVSLLYMIVYIFKWERMKLEGGAILKWFSKEGVELF
jgi:hypothetical protein